jgi:CubicO group peptidase (beta-lactamase class C family)
MSYIKHTVFLFALVLLSAGCYAPSIVPGAKPATAAQAAQAARLIDSIVAAQHLPGFAVTVTVGRSTVWQHAVGYADIASATPVTSATRFRIGSVSKLLTATLLMRLAQTERVDLDQPVSHCVPVPQRLGAVTMRQLAGHLGGVRHYRGAEFLSDVHYTSLADAIGVFANDTLVAPPGTRYSYSSYGFNLIGACLEHDLGMSFPSLMQRHVLEPLGLSTIIADAKGTAIPHRATLYQITADTAAPVPPDDLSGRWPSGGYVASTEDLARLGQSVLAPGLLDARSLEVTLTPQRLASGAPTNTGIGWRIGSDSIDGPYVHHGGSSNGGSAFLLVLPRQQLVVAMASNAFGQWSTPEALALARIFTR